ncbi:hypothetical protein NLJ89_g11476 [Agrocybe chaxingu]|uniref:Uncharacterized protein n=1 Tax=Agrocybe chaxingu TaxID=84603 RepID=A0A9W8JP46_9AGAR|nr:hypothetical protein NLJ89_g11476 [Agrocybe chaxingu]
MDAEDSTLPLAVFLLLVLSLLYLIMDGRDPPRRYPHRQPDPRRVHLQQVAATTIAAINEGYVDVYDHVLRQTARYDIRRDVDKMQQRTRFYPDNARELADWRKSPQLRTAPTPTHVSVLELSTLEGARYISSLPSKGRIGVLNFASATKPGVYAIQSVLSGVRSPTPSPTLNENLTQIITIVSSIVAVCNDNLPPASAQQGNEILRELSEHANKLSEVQALPEVTKESRQIMAKSSFAIANAMKGLMKL